LGAEPGAEVQDPLVDPEATDRLVEGTQHHPSDVQDGHLGVEQPLDRRGQQPLAGTCRPPGLGFLDGADVDAPPRT
jgi:hypothetical protein